MYTLAHIYTLIASISSRSYRSSLNSLGSLDAITDICSLEVIEGYDDSIKRGERAIPLSFSVVGIESDFFVDGERGHLLLQ